jgi:hypothetical protein
MFRPFAFTVMLLSPLFAFSWGKQGRHLTVEAAKSMLSEDVVSLVNHYLGTDSWTEASDWLETTTNPQNTMSRAQWHTVLVARDKTYVPTKSPNLINQIEYQLMVLEKRSVFPNSSVGEAIKTLFALVPEIHQPFRCGFTEDKGGSTVNVAFKGKNTTLMQFWDSELLAQRPCDVWDLSKIIMKMPSKTKKEIESAPPLTWANESRALLKDVYLPDKAEVTDSYLDKSSLLAKQQLALASIRLAAILNKHFKQ